MYITSKEKALIKKLGLAESDGFAEVTTSTGKTAYIYGNAFSGRYFEMKMADGTMVCTRAKIETIEKLLNTL